MASNKQSLSNDCAFQSDPPSFFLSWPHLPTPLWVFLAAFFLSDSAPLPYKLVSFRLLQAYLAYYSILLLMISTMFGFRKNNSNLSVFLILHSFVFVAFIGPNIFRGIFLSNINCFHSPIFLSGHISGNNSSYQSNL